MTPRASGAVLDPMIDPYGNPIHRTLTFVGYDRDGAIIREWILMDSDLRLERESQRIPRLRDPVALLPAPR